MGGGFALRVEFQKVSRHRTMRVFVYTLHGRFVRIYTSVSRRIMSRPEFIIIIIILDSIGICARRITRTTERMAADRLRFLLRKGVRPSDGHKTRGTMCSALERECNTDKTLRC